MDKDALWDLCLKFIKENCITCPETTVEDRVYENAPQLVEDIAEIVGYAKHEEEE